MTTFFDRAPRWQVAVVSGLAFGVFMGVGVTVTLGLVEDWSSAVVTGPSVGVSCGVLAGWWTGRSALVARADYEGLSPRQVAEANRAVAGRGPVPRDPLVRGAALRRASRCHRQAERGNRVGVPVFTVLTLGGVGLLVLEPRVELVLLVAALTVPLVIQVVMSRVWARRVGRLSDSSV